MRRIRVNDILSSEAFSVHRPVNEPLFPNLKSLELWYATGESAQFIPSFLSPRTTTISIEFAEPSVHPDAMVASMVTTLPTLCPNLQEITLYTLPKHPTTTAAVSGMLLASNRNTLRSLHIDSPLTEEALEVICELPNLRELTVFIEGDTSLPTLVLPNLTNLTVEYNQCSDWLKGFPGATLGKLETITFHFEFEQIGDFLEEFRNVALATRIQNALAGFSLSTSRSWIPNYSSLLPFTQPTHLLIEFSCDDGCSSTVDDDIITALARAMPRLQSLELGNPPCSEIPTGVTVKGLTALAHHCPDLSTLRVHFKWIASVTHQRSIWWLPILGPLHCRGVAL